MKRFVRMSIWYVADKHHFGYLKKFALLRLISVRARQENAVNFVIKLIIIM